METKEKEVFKDIPGYENYQVSDRGRVRSLDRIVVDSRGGERFYKGRVLDGNIHKGYRKISLNINSKLRVFNVSQLVAAAFLGHTPDGHTLVVDHINGDKLDDRLSNLRIVTHRENSTTCFRSDRDSLSSKYVGVSWDKRAEKWRADITFEGKVVYLGCYDDELEASKAYKTALNKIKDGTFRASDYKPNFTSKHKGVSWDKSMSKWHARIQYEGVRINLGYFDNELEASEAYQKFKKDLSQNKRCKRYIRS